MHAEPITLDDPIPAFLTQTSPRLRLVEPVSAKEPGELAVCGDAMLQAGKLFVGSIRLFGMACVASVRIVASRALRRADEFTLSSVPATAIVFATGLAVGAVAPFIMGT